MSMSDQDVRERFEIPEHMRSMAEAGVAQTRRTIERMLENAQATAGSLEERGATVRAGAKDVGAKAIACAERNVQASLDYADQLLRAKDIGDAMRLHGEYVQAQMRSLAEQVAEMGQVVSNATLDAAKPRT